MPSYVSGASVSILPGDVLALFNAETLTAPAKSIAVCRGYYADGIAPAITFEIEFASAPTNSLIIEGANIDLDAHFQTLYTSTNTQQDKYTDTGRWAFYRARLASQSAGGAVTVTAAA